MIEDGRICEYCELNKVQNKIHFILYCPFFNHDLRQMLFKKKVHIPDLVSIEDAALSEHLYDNFLHFLINSLKRGTGGEE